MEEGCPIRRGCDKGIVAKMARKGGSGPTSVCTERGMTERMAIHEIGTLMPDPAACLVRPMEGHGQFAFMIPYQARCDSHKTAWIELGH